ncbi:hypothetical protein RJ639_039241 [Escallonia herrerae]|uniref:MAPK kinase substrate protein n=1 Tax=Escallonia herrerae TaxID=1293975 RepID=A0AA88WK88_9ASTE|nr:hypothetical protein RJ639_039241 [Escallonia herrerae]
MEAGGLSRSEVSFRRSGSSGLIWDDKFLSGDMNKIAQEEKERLPTVQRSRSNNGRHAHKTVDVTPTFDPPSPKVSGCGICGMFGKPVAASGHRRKQGHRKS